MSHDALQYAALTGALVAVGLAMVLVIALENTRTNQALAAATLVVAVAIGTFPLYDGQVDPDAPSLGARLQGLFEVGGIVLYSVYMLAVLASSSLSGTRARVVRACAWATIALAGWHAVASYTWAAERLNDYEVSLGDPGVLSRPGFWLFAVFWLVLAVPYLVGWMLLSFGGDMDPAEERRARSSCVASVVLISVTAAPPPALPFLVALWVSLFIYGQLQYVTARARRGVFLSRFLSPQVTDLVASRGLAEAMKPHQAEITVVCADLRGFTAYSEGVPSQAVVDLLADYYDAIGTVVARYGGTITNYAGDGVLTIVGAPIPDPDHAATGIRIAREVQVAVEPVIERWRTRLHPLGLGVGVASGAVTVGAIAAETRMEYTAIGTPVNLAARLCSAAASGEVLVDAEATRLSRAGVEPRGEMEIKGFSAAQQVYALTASSPA